FILKIAMDYLPIQASTIPCRHVFSSSTDTHNQQCRHIGPTLMPEALQTPKFYL
ncbi:hypothetical protein EDC04DRAFT_2519329, partial [Pisolithus marmoratus]